MAGNDAEIRIGRHKVRKLSLEGIMCGAIEHTAGNNLHKVIAPGGFSVHISRHKSHGGPEIKLHTRHKVCLFIGKTDIIRYNYYQ